MQARPEKQSRDEISNVAEKIQKNFMSALKHFMDPSFDCKSQDYASIDRIRFFKQIAFGQLGSDTPNEIMPTDLELVTAGEGKSLGFPFGRCRLDHENRAEYKRKPKPKPVLNDDILVRSLQVFLEDENVSSLATRVRAVRIVHGEETRVRYLCRPLNETLLKYISLHPDAEVSMSSLRKIVQTKLKHIKDATPSNRETALCFAHDGATLLHQSLLRCGHFEETVFSDINTLIELSCCTVPGAEKCLEGVCTTCSGDNGVQAFADKFRALVPNFDAIADYDMSYGVLTSVNGGTAEYIMQYGTVLDFVGVSNKNISISIIILCISQIIIY